MPRRVCEYFTSGSKNGEKKEKKRNKRREGRKNEVHVCMYVCVKERDRMGRGVGEI